MVKALSENKVSKILALCFQGFSQTEIANKLKITQPSVSIHVSKFKSLAEQQGIMAAAEEYGVMDQVTVLFDLAAEFKKAKLTPEEAKNGLKMELLFQEYGVEPEDYGHLIETCEKLKKEDCFSAALELNQLEKGTGLSYGELVSEYKGLTDQLVTAHENLDNITGEIDTHVEELADINKQKKLATQDLKTHMEKVWVDEHRLELVETLALTLKKAGIPNQQPQNYIERQELLNKAEISIDILGDILGKSKVVTLGDKGKTLLGLLTECGSLIEAINKQQAKKQLLINEVSNLEQQAKLKSKLEVEINKLKTDKIGLEAHLTELEKQKKSHTDQLHIKQIELEQLMGLVEQEQASFQELKEKEATLEKEISEKQTSSDELDKNIDLKQQKVINLTQLETKQSDLTAEMKRVETRIDKEKGRLLILDGFLGLVHSEPLKGVRQFVDILPAMIKEAEESKKSPEYLRMRVLEVLTGGTFKLWQCPECDARFYVDKPADIQGYVCPWCHSNPIFFNYKNETEMLRIALPNFVPIRKPVVAFEIIGKPPSIKPQEMSDNKEKPGSCDNNA